ncbi:MAG: hypothetical protein HKN87_00945 [Saprospiraceae bacterium]|nr:hypothetical protein [Saprospiraceae bacterium]
MKPFLTLLVSVTLTSLVVAQSFEIWEDSLVQLTDSLMLSGSLSERQHSYNQLGPILEQVLSENSGSWNYPFKKLQRTSIVYPPDSSFRIFTGQFYIDEDTYTYYGLIQRRDTRLPIIMLNDVGWSEPNLLEEQLDQERWPGAVYYQLAQFEQNGRRYYLACGFHAFRMFENRKVAEVIYFEEDRLVLGAGIFASNGDQNPRSRLVLQYGADVGIRLTFDQQLDMLVFDNLIPIKSPYQKNRMVMVPDGSYSGYQQDEEGQWLFVEKVFHHTVSSPPLEMEVLNGDREKDLFGRKPRKR